MKQRWSKFEIIFKNDKKIFKNYQNLTQSFCTWNLALTKRQRIQDFISVPSFLLRSSIYLGQIELFIQITKYKLIQTNIIKMTIYRFFKEELNSKTAHNYLVFHLFRLFFSFSFFSNISLPIFLKYHQLKLSKTFFNTFFL